MAETERPMSGRMPGDGPLEEAFALARADAARPAPPDLMARVLADAARLRPQAAAPVRPAAPARRRSGPFAALLDVVGGWPALGGMATAASVGFWLGFAPPPAVEDAGGGWLGAGQAADLTGFLPDYELAYDLVGPGEG